LDPSKIFGPHQVPWWRINKEAGLFKWLVGFGVWKNRKVGGGVVVVFWAMNKLAPGNSAIVTFLGWLTDPFKGCVTSKEGIKRSWLTP